MGPGGEEAQHLSERVPGGEASSTQGAPSPRTPAPGAPGVLREFPRGRGSGGTPDGLRGEPARRLPAHRPQTNRHHGLLCPAVFSAELQTMTPRGRLSALPFPAQQARLARPSTSPAPSPLPRPGLRSAPGRLGRPSLRAGWRGGVSGNTGTSGALPAPSHGGVSAPGAAEAGPGPSVCGRRLPAGRQAASAPRRPLPRSPAAPGRPLPSRVGPRPRPAPRAPPPRAAPPRPDRSGLGYGRAGGGRAGPPDAAGPGRAAGLPSLRAPVGVPAGGQSAQLLQRHGRGSASGGLGPRGRGGDPARGPSLRGARGRCWGPGPFSWPCWGRGVLGGGSELHGLSKGPPGGPGGVWTEKRGPDALPPPPLLPLP